MILSTVKHVSSTLWCYLIKDEHQGWRGWTPAPHTARQQPHYQYLCPSLPAHRTVKVIIYSQTYVSYREGTEQIDKIRHTVPAHTEESPQTWNDSSQYLQRVNVSCFSPGTVFLCCSPAAPEQNDDEEVARQWRRLWSALFSDGPAFPALRCHETPARPGEEDRGRGGGRQDELGWRRLPALISYLIKMVPALSDGW